MAGYQRGNLGAGLSTAIGMPGSGSLFQVVAYFFQARTQNALKQRFGRDTSGELSFRFLHPGGGILVKGDIPGTQPPEPADWVGFETTLVAQYAANKTITWTVVVESFELVNAQKESDLYAFTAELKIVKKAVYSAGWGTATDGGSVDKFDNREYSGTQFVHDPDDLQTSGQITVDYWTLSANNDATLKSRLVTAISTYVATDFDSHLKNRLDTIHQDADDGGVMVFRFALTTTKEDALNEATSRRVDPNGLTTTETTAKFNGTPDVALTSGQVARETSFKDYNANETLQVTENGVRSTVQDLTFPGTPTTTDKSTIPIRSSRSETVVTGVNTEPSFTPGGNLKTNSWFKQQLTDAGKWLHRHLARLTTPQEDVENQSSVRHYDVSGLDDYEVRGKVLASVTTTDAGSSADTTLSQQGADITEINDNAIHHRYRWGKLTPAEQIQHGSNTRFNPADDLTGTTTVTDLITVATVTSTDSTAVIEAARRSSLLSDKRFVRTNVIKRNKTRAIYRDTYRNDDFQVAVSGMHTNREQRPTDATGAYVNITRVRAVTASLNEILLQPFDVTVTRGTVVLTRLFSTNSIITGHYQGALLGYTNAALFLGFGIGSLMYMGPQLIFNLTDTGTINSSTGVISGSATAVPVGFRYVYAFCSIGHYSQSVIPIGTWYPTTASVSIGTGTAATSIDAGWAPQGLGTGDFKEFLKG